MDRFLRKLPKVELHAHINGCVRKETMWELSGAADLGGDRRLDRIFQLFASIHQITTKLEHVTRITEEAIEDFDDDNVVYVELRTTPKNWPERGITKRKYLDAVLDGRDRYFGRRPDSTIVVKTLLSIDRKESAGDVSETIDLAIESRDRGVVGIDLSGDPNKGKFDDWRLEFARARSAGLKLAFHAGEIKDFDETYSLVDFGPDRLGHMCFVDNRIEEALLKKGTPIEICLSSNLITESVGRLEDHHVLKYHKAGHPIVICTDDPGVFDTTLSKEYELAAKLLSLDERQVVELVRKSVDHCFCDEDTKTYLRRLIEDFCAGNISSRTLERWPLE